MNFNIIAKFISLIQFQKRNLHAHVFVSVNTDKHN